MGQLEGCLTSGFSVLPSLLSVLWDLRARSKEGPSKTSEVYDYRFDKKYKPVEGRVRCCSTGFFFLQLGKSTPPTNKMYFIVLLFPSFHCNIESL
jgi:hypothetical protein